MSYIIFIFIKIMEGILWFIGIPLFFICYPLRHLIIKYPTLFKYLILYWFTNSDEPTYVDNWYGVYEILDGDYEKFSKMNFLQKAFLSFKWVSFRNPHWNIKLIFGKIAKGEMDLSSIKEVSKTIGDAPNTIFRNKTIFGYQHITYKVYGRNLKFFKYSFSRELKKWSPFRIFKFKYINIMFGYENKDIYNGNRGRLVSKFRIWK